jgi:hypothetical protein
MIIHRGKIHVRFRDNVAQRHVAKTAIGVKPFGGGKDGGPGPIARHISLPLGELQFKQLYETIV